MEGEPRDALSSLVQTRRNADARHPQKQANPSHQVVVAALRDAPQHLPGLQKMASDARWFRGHFASSAPLLAEWTALSALTTSGRRLCLAKIFPNKLPNDKT